MNDSDMLSQAEVKSFLDTLDKFGYPQVAVPNLFRSLGIDFEKYNLGTDGETSNMPRALADAVLQYVNNSSKIKRHWRNGINPYDLMSILPDRNSGHVTKEMALDALKIVIRGHTSQITKKLENDAVLSGTQANINVPTGQNFYIGESRHLCSVCGSNSYVFRSSDPFDDVVRYICFNCGNIEE